MKCEICDADVANSEELKAHLEREHPLDERSDEDELEKPDLMEEPVPLAPVIPGRN